MTDNVSKIIDLAQANQALYRCLEDIYIALTNEKTTIPESNISLFNDILKEIQTLKSSTKSTQSLD